MSDGFVIELEIGVREDGEDDGELGKTEAAGAESINDKPRVGEPGDFREDETSSEGDVGRVFFVALDEDMVRGGEADEELGGNDDDWVGNGGKDGGGRRAEEDSNEGLDDGKARRRARFNKDQPNGIANHEDEMDREKSRAGGVGEKDETDADNEIDEAGAEVEQPIAVVNGENTPFRNDDEDETDDVAAGDNGRADRDDGKEKIQDDMHQRTDCVAAFANKNIIGHMGLL